MIATKYALGVDLGGTNIRAAVVDSSGAILKRVKGPTGELPVEALHRLIEPLYKEYSDNIGGIGLAVAGLIDKKRGRVVVSPNIEKLSGADLGSELSNRYDSPVLIENDANAAALGEKVAGAGREFESFVLLTLGTGIGGGIVMNHRLLPVPAEIGHICINSGGEACACGNIGCLEIYASASAIVSNAVAMIQQGKGSMLKTLHNGNYYKLTAEDIYKAALEGEPLARTVLKDAGKSLGIGIASIINILGPQAVILTGGLLGAWNIYAEAAIKEASKRALKDLYSRVQILPSKLGDDAGIIGAAALVFEPEK